MNQSGIKTHPPDVSQKWTGPGNRARTLSAMSVPDRTPATASSAGSGPAPSAQVARTIALPMRTTLRVAGIALVIGLPTAGVVGAALDGTAGFWGAVLGLGIPAAFFGITVLTALLTAGSPSTTMVLVVGGAWVLKIAALFLILAVLADATFWSRTAFFVAFLVGVVGWLVAEVSVVARTRIPYVET
jgi:hypothetical protein